MQLLALLLALDLHIHAEYNAYFLIPSYLQHILSNFRPAIVNVCENEGISAVFP